MEILSGQHIPRPNNSEKGEVIDPYVEVKVRGHQDDFNNENNRHETEPVRNNGFSPSWREKFQFYLTAPELAFIEFKVREASSSCWQCGWDIFGNYSSLNKRHQFLLKTFLLGKNKKIRANLELYKRRFEIF